MLGEYPCLDEGGNMTHVISVVNQKGGVGKTTTAVNLSAELAFLGYEVLVLDLDPQGNCSSSFGVDKDALTAHAYHVLLGQSDLDSATRSTEVTGLSIVPTNTDLAGAEVELVTELGREGRLAAALSATTRAYDVIIIDCPPSLGLVTLNALVASRQILVPLQCEYFALEGVSQLLQTLELVRARINPTLELLGVALTMFDRRNKLSFNVLDEVQAYFGDLVFESIIPRNVRLSESPSHGKPIALYDPQSSGAIAYRALALELATRCDVMTPSRELDQSRIVETKAKAKKSKAKKSQTKAKKSQTKTNAKTNAKTKAKTKAKNKAKAETNNKAQVESHRSAGERS